MAEVKWIKITTDVFDDEKILLIESLPDAYAIITVWFKLLCLAGKQNNSGVFMMGQMPYTDKMLATIFRMKESTVTMALQTFEQFGMIEIIDGVITIPNWDKHQSLDAYAKKKERDRLYQQERRNKQKLLALKKSSDKSSDIAVSEEEKEEDKNKNKKKRYARAPFVPPTFEEVKAYCESRGNKVDAKQFYDYFSVSEWVDSNGKAVKNWKQKVITWESNRKDQRKVGANGIPIGNEKSDLEGVF